MSSFAIVSSLLVAFCTAPKCSPECTPQCVQKNFTTICTKMCTMVGRCLPSAQFCWIALSTVATLCLFDEINCEMFWKLNCWHQISSVKIKMMEEVHLPLVIVSMVLMLEILLVWMLLVGGERYRESPHWCYAPVYHTQCGTLSVTHSVYHTQYTTRSLAHSVWHTQYTKLSVPHSVYHTQCGPLVLCTMYRFNPPVFFPLSWWYRRVCSEFVKVNQRRLWLWWYAQCAPVSRCVPASGVPPPHLVCIICIISPFTHNACNVLSYVGDEMVLLVVSGCGYMWL